MIDEPVALPFCAYPTASDVHQHGVQPLPAVLPLVDFELARCHRSRRYAAVPATALTTAQVLTMAQVVATSFARREPQARHLQPARFPPPGLRDAVHADPFGSATFGTWNTETLLYWFIRLLVLTDPTSPAPAIQINAETLGQSLAIVDERGDVLGGALNETMAPSAGPPEFRHDDPFLDAVLAFVEPVLTLLGAQDAEGLKALSAAYPPFRAAHARGNVGHHFMVARSDALPKLEHIHSPTPLRVATVSSRARTVEACCT